jgi:hypothetical protein
MGDFIEDDVVGELRDVLDAYVKVESWVADRSRMMGEVCQECNEEIEELLEGGESIVADGLGRDWSSCYCYGCWSDWAAGEADFKPLFQPAGAYAEHIQGVKYCDYCDEHLRTHAILAISDDTWWAYDEDGYVACHVCWQDWARYGDDDEEDSTWCAGCETQLDGWPHVDDGYGTTYCMECWDEEYEEPAPKRAHVGEASARGDDAAGRARNERDKAKLRARYKGHCAYHLFHAHHRKHQGCTFAVAGQDRCARGSHGVPDDFEDAQAELETPARA